MQRYVEGNVTPQEIETVVDCLDADESHVEEYIALQKLYTLVLFNKPELQPSASRKEKRIRVRRLAYEWVKIAAIVLLVWGRASIC